MIEKSDSISFARTSYDRNPRTALLALDGVYCVIDDKPVFQSVRAASFEQLEALLHRLIKRIMTLLTKQGYLLEEPGVVYVAAVDDGRNDSRVPPLRQLKVIAERLLAR